MSEEQKIAKHSIPIVEKIKSYYGTLHYLKNEIGIMKDALYFHYNQHINEEMEEDPDFNPKLPLTLNGMVLSDKPNFTYEYDPKIKEEANDLGILQEIVKIKEKSELFFNLEPFRSFQEEFIKPIPVGGKRKTEEEKILEAEKRQKKVEDLVTRFSFDKLLSHYQELNTSLKSLKDEYDKDKELLLHAMTVDQIQSCSIDEITFYDDKGNEQILYHDGSYFKIMKSDMQYHKIMPNDTVEKYELFLIEPIKNNKYSVTNFITKEKIEIEEGETIPFDGIHLTVRNSVLYVDNVSFEPFTKDENPFMGKRDYTRILKSGGGLYRFSHFVSGEDFLMTCEVSGEGLDHLLTQGTINQSFINQYRKQLLDINSKNIFEIIAEEDHKKRLEMFSSMQTKKGQIRRMNDEARTYQ